MKFKIKTIYALLTCIETAEITDWAVLTPCVLSKYQSKHCIGRSNQKHLAEANREGQSNNVHIGITGNVQTNMTRKLKLWFYHP